MLANNSREATVSSTCSLAQVTNVRSAAAALPPEAIEQIAARVVHLLLDGGLVPPNATDEPTRPCSPLDSRSPLVDAATVAVALGVSRVFVYDHAYALG